MVLPTRWEGEAIGENVRSNAHEGQSQRYQFMKRATAISRTPFRNWTCENVLEWLPPRHSIPGISPTLPCTPGGMPHPMWQGGDREDYKNCPYNARHKPSSYLFFLSRSEEHTSELQSRSDLVCRLLLEKNT